MSSVLTLTSIVQVRMWCTLAEQASVNTFYYGVSAIATPGATTLSLIQQLDIAINVNVKSSLPSDAVYNGLQSRDITQVPLLLMDAVTTTAGPGTDVSAAMGRQLCGIGRLATRNAGPKYRGRMYFPFPPIDDDAVGGVPSNAYLAGLNTIFGSMINLSPVTGGGGSASVFLGVFHRASRTITPSTTFHAEPKWATQKRRGSFGRANASPI